MIQIAVKIIAIKQLVTTIFNIETPVHKRNTKYPLKNNKRLVQDFKSQSPHPTFILPL